MHFKNEKENFLIRITPEIREEGYYYIKTKLNIGEQNVANNVEILYVDGKVFFSWEGGDILTALAIQRLQDNLLYQILKKKGIATRSLFMGKSDAENLLVGPFTHFLTEKERSVFFNIQDEERRKVLEEINMKTAPHTLKKKAPQPAP